MNIILSTRSIGMCAFILQKIIIILDFWACILYNIITIRN